jgi:hypothetical protein
MKPTKTTTSLIRNSINPDPAVGPGTVIKLNPGLGAYPCKVN